MQQNLSNYFKYWTSFNTLYILHFNQFLDIVALSNFHLDEIIHCLIHCPAEIPNIVISCISVWWNLTFHSISRNLPFTGRGVPPTPIHLLPTIAVSVFYRSNVRIDPTTQQLISETCTCRYASTSATGRLFEGLLF